MNFCSKIASGGNAKGCPVYVVVRAGTPLVFPFKVGTVVRCGDRFAENIGVLVVALNRLVSNLQSAAGLAEKWGFVDVWAQVFVNHLSC